MNKLLPFAFLLCSALAFGQYKPGGIASANFSLWLSADVIADSSGSEVFQWMDQSGLNNHASTLGSNPILMDSSVNNMPAVVFSAAQQNALRVPHHPNFNSTYMSIFLVGKMNASNQSKSAFLVKSEDNNLGSGFGLLRLNSQEKMRFYVGDYTENRDSEWFSYGVSDLFVGNYRSNGSNNKITTLVNNAGGSTSTNAPSITNTESVYLGARVNNAGALKSFLDGAIAEVIILNEDVPSVDRIIISNYLAAKYQMGISNQKYSYFNSHSHRLIAIGKFSGVTRAEAQSDLLRIVENDDNQLGNSEFLMVADDGGSGLPIPTKDLHQFSQQLDRTWRAHVNGTINGENLRFNLANINAPATPSEFNLILDLDGDGDYTNASIIPATYYDATTNEMVFEDVNLITGSIFTLAFSNSITWDGNVFANGSGPNEAPASNDYHRKLYVYGPNGEINIDAHVNSIFTTPTADLSINQNVCFTVVNGVHNDGVITVEENASLIQEEDINTNSGTGNYFVKRTGMPTIHGFNNWSSPVARQNIIDLFPTTNHCDIFTYSALLQDWRHDYYPDFMGNCAGNPVTFSANSSILYGDNYMNIGRGYFVPGSSSHPQKVFEGTINNGTYHILLTATDIGHNPNWNDDDWNFVGNPYPSALDPFKFWMENAVNNNKITDALYFWDDLGIAGSEYDQYNDFSAWNLTGSIASDNSPRVISNIHHIASGQGFWVWADTLDSWDSAGVYLSLLEFNNSMRSCKNDQFFKTSGTPKKELIWLTMTSPSGDMVKTLVGMVENASDTKDKAYDARKPPFASGLSIASTIGTDTTGYMIQGVQFTNALQTVKKVGLKVNITQTGMYTFKRGAYEKTDDNTTVFLEDTYLHILHPIEQQDYTTHIGSLQPIVDRFKIVFKTTVGSVTDTPGDSITTGLQDPVVTQLSVYARQKEIVLDANQPLQGTVVVYDVTGRVIIQREVTQQSTLALPFNYPTNLYIVQYTSASGETTEQKVFVQ